MSDTGPGLVENISGAGRTVERQGGVVGTLADLAVHSVAVGERSKSEGRGAIITARTHLVGL